MDCRVQYPEQLARAAEAVFVVGHREETRCGEYIELTFLLDGGLEPSKVYFLWRSCLQSSSMVKELLVEYGFKSLDYNDENRLLWLVEEIISERVAAARSKA